MKRNIFYLLFAILLSACQQEELPPAEQALGYLSIENLSVEVKNLNYVSTRAVENDLCVEIWQNGQLLGDEYKYPAGEVPSSIVLKAGSYTLKAYNTESYQEGQPWYYAEKEFSITEGDINHITVEVPLKNIGVRLSFPEEYKAYFDYTFIITQDGAPSQTINDEDGSEKTCYFESISNGTISYTMNGTNEDGDYFTGEHTHGELPDDAKDGNIYVVTYNIATKSLVLQP